MRARTIVIVVLLLAVATMALAQRRGSGRGVRQARFATLEDFDGGYQFCRLVARESQFGDGAGWSVDYPRADENLSIRLSELTRTSVSKDEFDDPKPLLVNAGMAAVLSRCPFVMMSEPGRAYFTPEEAINLRNYLLKGGFLWADDYWGRDAWEFFDNSLRQVLPSGQFPVVDIPRDHVLFHQVLDASRVPQIPGIGYWDGRSGTWERSPSENVPHIRGIFDDHNRLMVLLTHDTDFGDSYERESEMPEYFMTFSVPGYAFGINVLIYAMTH